MDPEKRPGTLEATAPPGSPRRPGPFGCEAFWRFFSFSPHRRKELVELRIAWEVPAARDEASDPRKLRKRSLPRSAPLFRFRGIFEWLCVFEIGRCAKYVCMIHFDYPPQRDSRGRPGCRAASGRRRRGPRAALADAAAVAGRALGRGSHAFRRSATKKTFRLLKHFYSVSQPNS